MKNAGYDGIFFTGAAERPVCLAIDGGRPRLIAADRLRGKDTDKTDDMLQAELGGDGAWKISCIGPAGEQCSRLAGIVNEKGRIAARSGDGAVMGSRRLKAIAVRGKKGIHVGVADKEGPKAVQKGYSRQVKDSGFLKGLSATGTGGAMSFLLSIGDGPIKNWATTGIEAMPTANNLDSANMDVYKLKACGRSTW